MRKRILLILFSILLVGSLWLVTASSVLAQEEQTTEVAESKSDPDGASLFILLVGIFVVGGVGVSYIFRQSAESNNHQPTA